MTVAYSAYSKVNKKFVIGADNLEGWSGKIVSKIRVVLDRFAISVTGCDNPIHAFDNMRQAITDDKEIEVGWPNIHEVMDDLALWTKKYTEAQVKLHGNSPEVQRCLNKPEECNSTVIVFDSQTFELFQLEMKNIYPPNSFDPKASIKTMLAPETLHLHAMAKNRVNQLSVAPLPINIFSDTKNQLEAFIKMDKDFHDQARLTQPNVPAIGDLGSYCYYNDGKLQYVKLF